MKAFMVSTLVFLIVIGAAKDPAHAYPSSIADLAKFEHTFCKKEQNTGAKDILYKNQVQSAGACAILIHNFLRISV
jgi:hypothetical protein